MFEGHRIHLGQTRPWDEHVHKISWQSSRYFRRNSDNKYVQKTTIQVLLPRNHKTLKSESELRFCTDHSQMILVIISGWLIVETQSQT